MTASDTKQAERKIGSFSIQSDLCDSTRAFCFT